MKKFNFTLDEEDYEQLKLISEKQNKSISSLLRDLVKAYNFEAKSNELVDGKWVVRFIPQKYLPVLLRVPLEIRKDCDKLSVWLTSKFDFLKKELINDKRN